MTRYYSRSKQKFIDIATMTDQHVRNAFIEKCKHEPAEDAIYAQQQEERASRLQDRVIELEKTIRKLNNQPTVTADAYDVAWKKIETLERHKKDLRQSLDHALSDVNDLKKENQRLSSCYKIGEVLSERDKKDSKMDIDARDRRIAYLEKLLQAKNFVFSEIPNTPENLEMLKLLKKHLNKDMYRLRWRGQYLVDGEDWRKYVDGQPLSKSKCIRVYIDNLSAYGSTEGFNLDEIDKILSGLKDPTLIDYFEEMKFHIEECQQKMSEME